MTSTKKNGESTASVLRVLMGKVVPLLNDINSKLDHLIDEHRDARHRRKNGPDEKRW